MYPARNHRHHPSLCTVCFALLFACTCTSTASLEALDGGTHMQAARLLGPSDRHQTLCCVQDLACLKFLEQPSKAARRRWSKHAGMDKLLPQASDAHALLMATAAAAGPSPQPGQNDNSAQLASRGSVAAGDAQHDAMAAALAKDVVLIFGIHRFDT